MPPDKQYPESLRDCAFSESPSSEPLRDRRKSRTAEFQAFLRATPGLYVVLTPELKIVGASEEYLQSTLLWREDIRGYSFFDVFPDNPYNPVADGVEKLGASFQTVLETGQPHPMPIQQYDVRDYVSGKRDWVEKFWTVSNTPVYAGGSHEITHLIHEVQDITQLVHLSTWINEQSVVCEEQCLTLERMLGDLRDCQQKLRAAQQKLAQIEGRRELLDGGLIGMQRELGAPDSRRYFAPGDVVPQSGIYNVFHYQECERTSPKVLMRAGQRFPSCAFCRERVLYRFLKSISMPQ